VNRLHPRVRLVWSLGAAAAAAVVAGIAAAGVAVLGLPVWVPPVAFLALLALGVGHAAARYRVWRYEVREDALFLERGVLTRTRTVVPFVRVQHVDSARGPIERLFGLANVVVYTAGSRGADVTVPGLTRTGADDLRERLKRLAIRADGEDAV
jgi:membrane protein YdbS with pleckstrin-like domain